MNGSIFTVALPLALAVIMFGLGLSLTVGDFVRVAAVPKAAIVALTCQILVLPLIAFGLVLLFDLDPPLAVGLMLLAASPGGTTANLFSHLAGGDVALNVTLTAVNSVIATVTLPIVVGLSMAHFLGEGSIGAQPAKMLQVFAIVLVPVVIGMAVNRRFPAFAERARGPVKIASAVILVLVIAAALASAWDVFTANVVSMGSVALILSCLSLAVGYWVPKLFGVDRRQSIASAMEIGIHNSTLAITVALSVLDSEVIAIPPAMYGIVMFLPAAVVAYVVSRRRETAPTAAAA